MSQGELTGGRVSYYLAEVKDPQREDQAPYMAECEDIIQALQMDFNEACEFKAIWRTAAARLGNGKPGQKALYDAEKRAHYAQRSVRQLKFEQQEAAKEEGVEIKIVLEGKETLVTVPNTPPDGSLYFWKMHTADANMPAEISLLQQTVKVDVKNQRGTIHTAIPANQVYWPSVSLWRLTQ